MSEQSRQQANINRTVGKLCLMVVGMICFVAALVPLYDLFCEITGLNGKTGGPYTFDEAKATPDTSRLIRVNFLTNTNEGMVWKFWPEKGAVRVNPGAANTVSFFVKNTTDRVMVGQAIPLLCRVQRQSFFTRRNVSVLNSRFCSLAKKWRCQCASSSGTSYQKTYVQLI